MRRLHMLRFIGLIFCFVTVTVVGSDTIFAQQRTKEFTIEDIFVEGKFASKSIRGFQWIGGGKAFSYLETDTATKYTNIWRHDVASGNRTKLVDASKLIVKEGDKPFSIRNYQWSPDSRSVLFTGTLVARAVKTGGNFFLYDLDSETFKQLTDSEEEQLNVKFSPDGKMIGFVRANNLFIQDLESGREVQLTFDGSENVLNGHFDWVYEEEFSVIEGWHWSPDGAYIAYWQLDQSREPEFPIVDFLPLHQGVTRMRYPKAGDPNAIVRVGILSLDPLKKIWASTNNTPEGPRLKPTWVEIGAPFDSTQDTYIPRLKWTATPNVVSVQRLNRKQNELEILLVDATTGQSRVVLTEQSDTWVDVRDDLTFLKTYPEFIWSSDRDGYLHLYRYDNNGKMIRQITKGQWDIDKVIGVDEVRGWIYFTAAATSPLNREVHAVKLDGSVLNRITKDNGSNSANFAPDFSYFLHTFSDASTPPRHSLRDREGSLVRIIEEGTISALEDYRISPMEFFSFKTSDGVELNAYMIKPHDFDPGRKYPVLMHVYGGPGSQTVRNSWGGGNFFWHQMLAQKGYIIVSVDNRGTGARGSAFEKLTYKNLGKWETHDQIEGAKYLASLPYVDSSRIGIWGSSYGGYMTLLSLLQGNDVFKAGISVAPVTHWKFYDTIYTERYMLTPAENPRGYEESAPTTHAARLRGKLLIVHGTADDNVHWQNTVSMVDELIKAGKQFETAFYPRGLHGVATSAKVRGHLYTKYTNFLLENL